MKQYNLFTAIALIAVSSSFSAAAHDSHTHEAPWQACSDKEKSQSCSYHNKVGDLFKGSCQAFSDVLMCVRNQPIIHADELGKEIAKELFNEDISEELNNSHGIEHTHK